MSKITNIEDWFSNKSLSLEEWFLESKNQKFPKDIDYILRYQNIKEVAIVAQEKIHQGNVEVENTRGGDSSRTLTGHDPKHFKKVIKNASELVRMGKSKLTSYEIFFLLSAIQIHDIGNIMGREDHQKTAIDVFYDLMPANVVLDSVETSIIHSIAEVHTQSEGEDKDTISKLGNYEIGHNDQIVRHQLLAAILKLADELADDPERAFMYGVKNNLVKEDSNLFHVYCNCLKSTVIKDRHISVAYKFEEDDVHTEYNFGENLIFLLDYIFIRNIKMHLERVYCQRFLTPEIFVDHIDIEIAIYTKDYRKKLIEIKYRLIDKGYPQLNGKDFDIKVICADPENQLKNPNGDWWDGPSLKNYIDKNAG
ncbi:hypothetical protein [Galbibacter sp.]|uniref:HD domain-containing protein n=1 Tax=Galbibacter sp. TaxID=2918471 RepID=UPI003A8F898C